MKRILFVIDSLNSGGAEKSLVSLLSLFNFQKYKVDLQIFSSSGLFLPLIPEEINRLEIPEFIKIQQMNVKFLIKNKHFKELYLRLRASIALRNPFNNKKSHNAQTTWKWMSKGIGQSKIKYDVAIAYSQGTPTYYVAEKVTAKKKICWINTDYKSAPYNKYLDQHYYEKFDNIIAVSDLNKSIFTNELPNFKDKTSVIYDIVSENLIHSMASQDGGFDGDFEDTRILTIGRLVEAKGLDIAIEACRILKENGFKFKWYVIGEGALQKNLEKTIKEHKLEDTFILLGTYQNPYVFMKGCDIYVQPSRFEGFGLAIAEARILKKPIVATNFTVVRNQIEHRENGLIVNMNSNSLYEGIKELLEDENLRNSISQNLRKEKVGTEQEINKLYSLIENT